MRIQHNIMALNAYRQLGGNNSALAKNLEKLSSGYRINRAGDDAAGLAISEKMRAQIKGLEAAQKNANDGISLVQTAEGALTEVHSMLNRMVYLATQSANGTYDNEVDRANLDKEVQTLKEEINRISQSTNFNGIKLLDGSMDSATKTVNNKVSDSFKIADWVGTKNNADAVVGTGTIVHTGSKEAKATEFSVEFNNSTVAGNDGVSITIGNNEKLTIDNTEIAAGASAEEIAAAFAAKYSETELLSDTGEKVKFNVTADGDRLVFTQADAPASADQVVNGDMTVKYEGIGSAAGATENLNVQAPTTKKTYSTGLTGMAADLGPANNTSFDWSNGATDEAKDALNTKLKEATASDLTFTITANNKAGALEAIDTYDDIDLSGLKEALGADYTIAVKATGGAAQNATIDEDGLVTGLAADNSGLDINILDKDGIVGTLHLDLANPFTGATVQGATSTTVSLKAGDIGQMNTAPTVDVADDPAGIAPNTAHDYDGNAGTPDTVASFVTFTNDKELLDAFNKAIGKDGAGISISISDLTGNAITADTSKVSFELDQVLKDAGYKIVNADDSELTDNAATISTADQGAFFKGFKLVDEKGNKIADINIETDTTSTHSATPTKLTFSQSSFNEGAQKTGTKLSENVGITLNPADAKNDTAAVNDWTDNATALTLSNGSTIDVKIGDKTYTVTAKNGGLTDDETRSGLVLDTSVAGNMSSASALLTKLTDLVQNQMNAEADKAAAGTVNYTKNTSLALTVNNTTGRIEATADTTDYTYAGAATGNTPGEGGAAVGGKDFNASTVNIKAGNAASDGRLASTYITADDLAGLKDGSQLKVGDTVYTFAVGKDSKATGDNIIDLKDMEASDAELLETALTRLTETGNPNSMFSIGHDGTRVTFTENKDYKWGEGVDLSTKDGIAEQFGFYTDGMTTTSTGKALSLQVGDTADDYQKVGLDIKDMSTDGLDIADIDIKTQESASAAIDKIKTAINTVSSQRGDLGAIQNRLEHTINNLGVQTENITAAESRIRDTDMAEEMMAYTKNNILIQAAQAMLAQANQVPQGVLQLLQ